MDPFFLFIDKSTSPNTVDQDLLNQDCFFIDDTSGCIIASEARIDYRQELAGKLSIKKDVAEGLSDSKLILSAYLKWGEACLSHLYGDFSFVIWNPSDNELLCARDHFGCKPLYYVDREGFLAVASQLSAFKKLPGFSFEIREQYILDSICSIVKPDTLSAYRGISKLKPAHYLKQGSGQLSAQIQYWDLRIHEEYGRLTLEEASDGLRERIVEAVRQRSQTSDHIGVELSGGLDSSGIASVLTILMGKDVPIHAFTHSISSEDLVQHMSLKSDMVFSEALLEKYPSIKQFKVSGEHSEGGYFALTNALYRLNKPINLHYALNSDLLFETAGNVGTSIIFSGLGGDEGITNNGSGYFNELIQQGQHSILRYHVRANVCRHGGHVYRQLVKHYISYYAPGLIYLFKKDWRKALYHSFAIQKSLARKYRMRRRFSSAHFFPRKADLRATQYFRIMYPNIPERIEETSLLAQQHEIEYSYPFLDVKLLEFFYSLPSAYKYKDGLGRYLFRMAMKEVLPENIRMRTSKEGNTIPNVFVRVLKDEQLFRETIDEGRLNNHYHYVDYARLDDMLDSFKEMGKLKQQDYGLRAFQSAMSVLILQKRQREGEIDIGIKC